MNLWLVIDQCFCGDRLQGIIQEMGIQLGFQCCQSGIVGTQLGHIIFIDETVYVPYHAIKALGQLAGFLAAICLYSGGKITGSGPLHLYRKLL